MTQQSDDIAATCFGQTTIDMAMLLSATLEQPMNIYFSPTVIVFTRTDGAIYQHWIDGFHPIQLPSPTIEEPPVVPEVSPAENATVEKTTQQEETVSPPPKRKANHDKKIPAYLSDLNGAKEEPIPKIARAKGAISEVIQDLVVQFAAANNTRTKDRKTALLVAYHMGKVLKNYPVSTKQQLQKQLSAGMHVHMLNTIRRVFEVGSRVGLSRLMGTKELTAVGLSRLTLKAYKEQLLSNLMPTLYLE